MILLHRYKRYVILMGVRHFKISNSILKLFVLPCSVFCSVVVYPFKDIAKIRTLNKEQNYFFSSECTLQSMKLKTR
jgi:hypothetical protein